MRKLSSRETFLIVVVAGAGILGWIYGGGGNIGGSGLANANLKPLKFADPPVVELTLLGLEPDDYDSGARNLFSYYVPPPPPRPKRDTSRAAPQRQDRPKVPDPVKKQARPVVPKPEPKAPRPSFRYIGFMGPKNNKIAVLEKGEQVLLAEIGEVVEKQFVVRSFKYEILVLGFTAERWKDETHELPMKR